MVLHSLRLSMHKIHWASQNTEAKTLPADVCIIGWFGQLSPAAVNSVDCQFDSRVKWWIYVSSMVTYLRKTPFCCVKTVANNALNRRRVVVFDWLWANAAPTLNKCSRKMVNTLPFDIFNSSAISFDIFKFSAITFDIFKFSAISFDIFNSSAIFFDNFNSTAISRNFNLRSVKTSLCSVFFLFSGTTAEFRRPDRSSFMSVRQR